MSLKIKSKLLKIYNFLVPSETIQKSKNKWNELAHKNGRYYVLSTEGEGISEESFRFAGEKDYNDLIKNDVLLNQKIGDFKDKSVLEVGCGLGRVTEFLGNNFKEVVGIDISEKMIEDASVRLKNNHNIRLLVGDGVTYPLPSDHFDFVFSYIVFQHMPSEEVVKSNLKEVCRVLKPGGIAKIQLRGVQVKKSNWYYGPSFDKNKLKNLLNGLDFTLIREEGEGHRYYWITLVKNKV